MSKSISPSKILQSTIEFFRPIIWPVYECCYPGCRKQSDQPGRCQHGRAQVEMRIKVAVPHSRTDSFAGKGKGKSFNSYGE